MLTTEPMQVLAGTLSPSIFAAIAGVLRHVSVSRWTARPWVGSVIATYPRGLSHRGTISLSQIWAQPTRGIRR